MFTLSNISLIELKHFNQITSRFRTEIMGLAMLSIMLFHQCFTNIPPFNIFHNFGYWGVDIFLFLSGMGLIDSLNKNTLKEYYKRRLKRIIPSCLLCGTTKYLLFTLFYSSLFILKDGLNIGIWSIASLDLWYIHTIIILYLISPFLLKSLNKHECLTIGIIIILFFINGLLLRPNVGFDWLSPIGIVSWTIERLPVFTLGMLTSIKKRTTNRELLYSALFFILAIALVLLEKTHYSFYSIRAYMLFSLTLGMLFFIVFCISILIILPTYIKKFLLFLGTYSLELYLVHEFIFWGMKIVFININPWVLLISSTTLSCLSAYICKNCTKAIHLNNKERYTKANEN